MLAAAMQAAAAVQPATTATPSTMASTTTTTTPRKGSLPLRGRGHAGPTYEAVIASNTQEITIGKHGAADLTDAQLSGPMRNGAFVGECGAPVSTRATVHVAIKMGRAAGVSVATSLSPGRAAIRKGHRVRSARRAS